MRRATIPVLLLVAIVALIAAAMLVRPAPQAAGAVAGATLSVCVSPVRPGDAAPALFGTDARFDCTSPQTRFGQGDFWVIAQPLAGMSRLDERVRVRIASLWQERVTLYALYPGGVVRRWSYDGHAATRHLQLGGMIEWPLPQGFGRPERLMWRVDGSANLRGILLAPRLATPHESGHANMVMAATYAGFAGLCIALLIYNLAMWGALRHRFQLLYCAMVLALLLYAFSSSGALAWANPAMLNNDRLRINYVLLATAAATALMFARSFFPPSISAGWVGRLIDAATAIVFVATMMLALFAPWQIRALDIAFTLSFAAIMAATAPILWRAWLERSPHLWLFTAAWAAPIVFAGMRLLGNLALVPWSFWLDNSTILSMASEAVISTLAIAYRIRMLALERDEAIEREIIAARLADIDPLTGLLNRRAFLRQAIGRDGDQMLLIADLDLFKQVNETLGHDGGDEVLRVFARTLRQAAPAGALIARMGGEEFAILCPVDRAVAPDVVLNRVRAARMPFDVHVTASIGACSGPMTGEREWKAMYRRADSALFEAKQAGRDRARLAPPNVARAA
ncbi:MAG: diguanylate cyclase [Pseudomonadota bacterium]